MRGARIWTTIERVAKKDSPNMRIAIKDVDKRGLHAREVARKGVAQQRRRPTRGSPKLGPPTKVSTTRCRQYDGCKYEGSLHQGRH